MRRWVGGAAGAIVLAGLSLASCGLPTDDAYRPIDPDALGALAETTTTSTSTTTTLPPETTTTIQPTTTTVPTTEPVTVYFVDGNQQLTPVSREATIPATPDDARSLLQQGVLPTDPAGLRTSIPAGALLSGVTVTGGRATVNLAPAALEPIGNEQVLQFAQIVLTLTEQRGVGQVEFRLTGADGVPMAISVPKATFEPAAVVTRDDYLSLVAPDAP